MRYILNRSCLSVRLPNQIKLIFLHALPLFKRSRYVNKITALWDVKPCCLRLQSPGWPWLPCRWNLDIKLPVITASHPRRLTFSNAVKTWSNTYYKQIPELILLCLIGKGKGKGKAVPIQVGTGPEGFRKLKLQDFVFKSRHMKVVRLSALRTGHLPPPQLVDKFRIVELQASHT